MSTGIYPFSCFLSTKGNFHNLEIVGNVRTLVGEPKRNLEKDQQLETVFPRVRKKGKRDAGGRSRRKMSKSYALVVWPLFGIVWSVPKHGPRVWPPPKAKVNKIKRAGGPDIFFPLLPFLQRPPSSCLFACLSAESNHLSLLQEPQDFFKSPLTLKKKRICILFLFLFFFFEIQFHFCNNVTLIHYV